MSYRLNKNETVPQAVRRIAGEQVQKAIAEIDDAEMDVNAKVHQVRKRCKKIRGLLRLVRPELDDVYREENAEYRDAAQDLSDLRDAHAIYETCNQLLEFYSDQIDLEKYNTIPSRLKERRDVVLQDSNSIEFKLKTFREKMEAGAGRIDSWPLEEDGFDTLSEGLAKTYRRGRKAMDRAYQDANTENFHEWRKRVKYHWYHIRLLTDCWPEVMKSQRDEVHRLSEYLGDEHNLAVLRETLIDTGTEYGRKRDLQVFYSLIDRRRAGLRAQAAILGRKLFCEKPGRFTGRIRCYHNAWMREIKPLKTQIVLEEKEVR